MSRRARLILILAVAALCVGCDQVVKTVARDALQTHPPIRLLGGTVVLEYAENPGGMLGFAGGLEPGSRFWLLGVAVALSLALVGVFAVRTRSLGTPSIVCLSLFLGGGLGNLIDRMREGVVVDYIHLGVGSLRTGVFNVADVAIMAGAIGFLLLRFRQPSKTVH